MKIILMFDLNKKIYKYFPNLFFGKLLDAVDYYNYKKNIVTQEDNKKRKFDFKKGEVKYDKVNFFPSFRSIFIKLFLFVRTKKFYGKIHYARLSTSFLTFMRKSIVIHAYFEILKKIKKKKNVLIVYDCSVSPASFGDFVCTVLLARFFLKLNKNIFFIIISGEYRSNWPRFKSEKGIQKNLKLMRNTAQLYLKGKSLKVQEMSWEDFIKTYEAKRDNFIIPFENRVFSRNRTYLHAHNFLFFSYRYNKKLFEKMSIKKNEYSNIRVKKVRKPYICFHSSHPENGATELDIKIEEFVPIIRKLQKLYKDYEIMIVSDQNGCNFFKKVCKKNGLKCLFSKDISLNILSDLKLIMSSKLFLKYSGGGISTPIHHSNLPHIAVHSILGKKGYFRNEIVPPKGFLRDQPWLKKNQFSFIVRNYNEFLKFVENNKLI